MKACRQLIRKPIILPRYALLFFVLLIPFGIAHAGNRYLAQVYEHAGYQSPIGYFSSLAEAEAALRNSDSPQRQNLELKESYEAGGYAYRLYWNPTVPMEYGPWTYNGYGSEGEAYSAFVQNALRAGMCTMEGQPVNDWTEHGETGPYGNPGPGERRQRIYNFFGTWSWATNPPCTRSGWVQYWGMGSSRKISCPPRTPNYIFRSEPDWPDWHCSSNVIGVIVDTSPVEECKNIAQLKPLATDKCTQALEKGLGEPIPPSDCRGLSDAMIAQESCLRNKIEDLGIAYKRTAGVRTTAYQMHLRDIWNNWKALQGKDPKKDAACADKIRDIVSAKEEHEVVSQPAINSNHEKGNAIDVSITTVKALIEAAAKTKYKDVSTYVQSETESANAPGVKLPACNLTWGGTFGPPNSKDIVHFQLR